MSELEGTDRKRPVSRETGSDSEIPAEAAAAPGAVSRETEQATHRSPLRRLGTTLALAPIRFYRRLISPLLGPRCRYYPTCSAYAEEAVRTLGPARGIIVASWRVLRCNPMSPGGLDPLENRRLFRPKDKTRAAAAAGCTKHKAHAKAQ